MCASRRGKGRRCLDDACQRYGIAGQGFAGIKRRQAMPVDGGCLVGGNVEIIAKGGTQRGFKTRLHLHRVDQRRPQVAVGDGQQVRQGLDLSRQLLRLALQIVQFAPAFLLRRACGTMRCFSGLGCCLRVGQNAGDFLDRTGLLGDRIGRGALSVPSAVRSRSTVSSWAVKTFDAAGVLGNRAFNRRPLGAQRSARLRRLIEGCLALAQSRFPPVAARPQLPRATGHLRCRWHRAPSLPHRDAQGCHRFLRWCYARGSRSWFTWGRRGG